MRRSSKTTVMRPESTDKAVPLFAPAPPRTEVPHVIHADGVYTVEDLRRVFGLKASSVRREVRLGLLRMSKRWVAITAWASGYSSGWSPAN
jgi:hypothetical protein